MKLVGKMMQKVRAWNPGAHPTKGTELDFKFLGWLKWHMATTYQSVTSISQEIGHRKVHHQPSQNTPHSWCPHGRLEIPPMRSHHPRRGARQDLRFFWEQKFICMNYIAQTIHVCWYGCSAVDAPTDPSLQVTIWSRLLVLFTLAVFASGRQSLPMQIYMVLSKFL